MGSSGRTVSDQGFDEAQAGSSWRRWTRQWKDRSLREAGPGRTLGGTVSSVTTTLFDEDTCHMEDDDSPVVVIQVLDTAFKANKQVADTGLRRTQVRGRWGR